MFKRNRKKCTMETIGTIIDTKYKGADYPTILTVQYTVNNEKYIIKETAKMKSSAIYAGKLCVGQKKCPKIGDITLNTKVKVMYNPNKPSMAYLADNIGKVTS